MRQVYTHAASSQFAFANGDERATVLRIDDVSRKEKQHRRDRDDGDMEFSRKQLAPKKNRRWHDHAVGSVGQLVPVLHDNHDDQSEPERDHRDVERSKPERRKAENVAGACRQQRAHRNRKPIRDFEIHDEQRSRIAADRRKPCLPQRNLPGVAHDKIHAQHGDAVDDREAEHKERIIGQKQRRGCAETERERDHRERHLPPRRELQARFPSASPKIP